MQKTGILWLLFNVLLYTIIIVHKYWINLITIIGINAFCGNISKKSEFRILYHICDAGYEFEKKICRKLNTKKLTFLKFLFHVFK